MYIRFIFFLLFCYFNSSAQIVLIKVNAGDCTKCINQLETLSDLNSKIATYFVLPEDRRNSAADFELKFSSFNFNFVYSDYLYDKFSGVNISSIAYLNVDGNSVLQIPLHKLNKNYIDSIIQLYKTDYLFQCKRDAGYRYLGDNKFYFQDFQLGSHFVFEDRDTLEYKMDSVLYHKLVVNLEKASPGFYNTSKLYKLNDVEWHKFLWPKFLSVSFDKDNVLFYTKIPYFNRLSTGEVVDYENDDFELKSKYAIISFKGRELLNIHPIDFKFSETMDVVAPSFCCYDSTLLLPMMDFSSKVFDFNQKYLAKFQLKDGMYKYDRHLNSKLPACYGEGDLHLGFITFENFDFPNYIDNLAQSFFNIDEDKQLPFVKDSIVNHVDFGPVKRDRDNPYITVEMVPLYNLSFFEDEHSEFIYQVSLVNGVKFIRKISVSNWSAIKTVNLVEFTKGICDSKYRYSEVSKKKKMLYSADKNGYVRGYPLSLFFD